jgi:Malectin domain
MKSVLLIMTMATNVFAFEQIFAVNSGGDAHTDSDGIIYQQRVATNNKWHHEPKDYKNVIGSDQKIYQSYAHSYLNQPSIKYEIPLKSDGLYLLIAKYSFHVNDGYATQDMMLNNEIQLASNLNVNNLCGGKGKICDEYYYFCVSDKTIYYKNLSSIVQDEKILIATSSTKGFANMAGLVVLKGSVGERQHLKSSATNELLHFDLKKIHPKCLETSNVMKSSLEDVKVSVGNDQQTILNKIQNQPQEICSNDMKNEAGLTYLTELLNQQLVNIKKETKSTVLETIQKTSNQILMEQSRIQTQSAEQMNIKFERLHSELINKSDQANKNKQEEQSDKQQLMKIQQATGKMTSSILAELNTSIAQYCESHQQSFIQQMQQMQQIQNQTTETLISKFESLQSELTTHTNQTNKNFEILQTIVRLLVDDNRNMQAEIKKMAEYKEESAKCDSLKSEMQELTNQVNGLRDVATCCYEYDERR